MNRIDRLHAILVHLQSKKRVTAQEIADRFDISLRSVYRDIKALEESGVPVIGEAGLGYTIMEGYRCPPVMFTREEASALLFGVKLTEQMTDGQTRNHIDNALYKIKSVLRTPDKEHLDQLADNVMVAPLRIPVDERFNKYLGELQKAILAGLVVHIEYFAPYNDEEQKTCRDVEPFGLVYYSHAWHCMAWCRLRKGYRDFKLTRIQDLRITGDTFDRSAHPALKDHIQKVTRQGDLREAVLLFDKEVVRYLHEQKYYYGFVSEESKGDQVRMTFLSGSWEMLAHWVLSYLDRVRVEGPDELREVVRGLVERLQKNYL